MATLNVTYALAHQ